jgi:hypothetical protein
MAENKTTTTPPRIIVELVPPAFAMNVEVGQRLISVDFEIDADGLVADLIPGPTAPELSPDIEELLRSIRFYPALASGTPIKSRGTFALSEFIR